MSHINLEDSIARRVRHFASRFGSTELTLTGEYNVSPESGSFHFLNPGGANRTVRLPVIEPGGGQLYIIVNTGTGSLNVVNNSGVAVSTLNTGRMSFYVSSTSTWQAALVAQNLTPENAEYFVGALHSDLSNERLVKDSGTITWDFSVPGEAKANTVSGGGNVSNFGTPLVGQVARWVNATTIEGVSAAGVFQPADGDLTALSNLTGSNVIYYRVGADTWAAVTIGTGLSFTTGTLTATGGGGGAPTGAEYITASSDATLSAERVLTNTATITWDFTTAGQAKASSLVGGGNVSNSGTPSAGQYGKWVTATTIQGVAVGTVLTDIGAQPLDATLTSLAAYNTNGILTQTAADTFTGRTLTGPAAGIAVTNGNGVSGNPTLALSNDLAALEALAGTNNIYYRAGADTWSSVTIGASLSFSGGTLAAAAATINKVGKIVVQSFAASGTYTPSANLLYALIECQGGGGGGGGTIATGGNYTTGCGGGGGAYARALVTAAAIGASKAVTIGAGGTASSGSSGTAGGATSVGALCVASGGGAGPHSQVAVSISGGPLGGQTGTGDLVVPGGAGGGGVGGAAANVTFITTGWGGSAYFGGGQPSTVGANGNSAVANSGAGGSGGSDLSDANKSGGAGGSGFVIITEYCVS